MDINHPIKRVEVSAIHESYPEVRRFADTLTGQPYWSVCDSLTEHGYELEFDVIEDNAEEFMVNYVLKEKPDIRLGTISIFVGVNNEKIS